MSKKDENAVRQCTKCECLFFAEKSRPQSQARSRKTRENQPYIDDDESSDSIVISPACHETVKIFVGTPCGKEFCNDKRNGNALADTAPHKVHKKPAEKPPKKQDEKAPPSHEKAPPSLEDAKTDPLCDPDKEKRHCFRFCRKKKKSEEISSPNNDPSSKSTPTKLQDCNTQTCQAVPNSSKTQISETNIGEGAKNPSPQRPEMDIAEIIKSCRTCPSCARQGSGGCNTNTIIFPGDKSGGDGLTCLENWLRLEAKVNSHNFEDVLNELHKVKRDIHDLKDMLDAVSRAVREQLFMSAYGKGKSELLDDLNRQKNLDRKPNTTPETARTMNNQKYLERKTNTTSLSDAAVAPGKAPNMKRPPGVPPATTATYVQTPKLAHSAPATTSQLSKPPASEDVVKVTTYAPVAAPPPGQEEVKKKRFFPWCK